MKALLKMSILSLKNEHKVSKGWCAYCFQDAAFQHLTSK